jgi:hypothetical protein
MTNDLDGEGAMLCQIGRRMPTFDQEPKHLAWTFKEVGPPAKKKKLFFSPFY